MPQIEVSFDIDANGIVHVNAKDLGTGKEQSIRITASSGLTEDEIEQMVKDAEVHADEDHKRRETVEAHNQLDGLIYQTEKNLAEHGGEVDPAREVDHRGGARGGQEGARERRCGADEGGDWSGSRTAQHKLAEAMYAKAARPGAGARRRRRRRGRQRRDDRRSRAAATTSSTPTSRK